MLKLIEKLDQDEHKDEMIRLLKILRKTLGDFKSELDSDREEMIDMTLGLTSDDAADREEKARPAEHKFQP